jgi:hypothetical protein
MSDISDASFGTTQQTSKTTRVNFMLKAACIWKIEKRCRQKVSIAYARRCWLSYRNLSFLWVIPWVIPVNRVVGHEKNNRKNGGLRRRRGTRDRWSHLKFVK